MLVSDRDGNAAVSIGLREGAKHMSHANPFADIRLLSVASAVVLEAESFATFVRRETSEENDSRR